MAFPSLYLLYVIEDLYSPAVSVKVVGHQWYWEYQLSNSWFSTTFDSYIVHEDPTKVLFHGLDVDNRLVLPTLCSILFLISSADVLHSWTVPSLGVKADAIPGRLNFISSKSNFSGVYYGQCSEICGANHSFMPIVVEFLPLESFLVWVSKL
jgi:cytochrome c oxidase subunit 2